MKAFFMRFLNNYFPLLFARLRGFWFEHHVLPKEFVAHLKLLSTDHLVYDLGANVGLVSQVMAKTGARVIAFEPNEVAFKGLAQVAAPYKNIELRNEAAGVVDNVKKLYLHKDSKNTEEDLTQASSFLANKPNVAEDQYQEVSEVDFSRVLLDQNQPVELVKIDIEGYEIDLINHLLDTGAVNCVRSFYVETHERKFSDLAVPTAMLKDRIKREGYEDRFFFDWH